MVFTKLDVREKEAFFGLLDEYFQSRPEIFGQNQGGSGIPTAAAASVVQRAFGANANSNGGTRSNPSMPNVDVGQAMSFGRVAASSLAFSGPAHDTNTTTGGTTRSNPSVKSSVDVGQAMSIGRLAFSGVNANASNNLKSTPDGVGAPSLPRRTEPGHEVDKLVTAKGSMWSALKKPPGTGVVSIPPAFGAPKGFAPPPVRRVTSTETGSGSGPGGAGAGGAARLVPQPPPEREPEPEANGEWADVLYDYSSEDPGDLTIQACTRVFVTAKSSEDWWTGQIEGQGREGLFPASYVRLL